MDDESSVRARGRPRSNICWALAIALIVGVALTVAGALVHSEERRTCNEGNNGCVNYDVHGWPWEWRSDGPNWVLERQIQNSDPNFFSMNEGGLAPGVFIFIALMWFFAITAAEAAVGLSIWTVRSLLSIRSRASPA
jgi:hypothetical protein